MGRGRFLGLAVLLNLEFRILKKKYGTYIVSYVTSLKGVGQHLVIKHNSVSAVKCQNVHTN